MRATPSPRTLASPLVHRLVQILVISAAATPWAALRFLRPATLVAGCTSTSTTAFAPVTRSEEHTSELQSRGHLVCRLLLEKKKDGPKQSERLLEHVLTSWLFFGTANIVRLASTD